MGRRVEDIREDINSIDRELSFKKTNPKIAEYLRRKQIVDDLKLRMAALDGRNEKKAIESYNNLSVQLKEKIKELADYLENEADDSELRSCVRLMNLRDNFIIELQAAREIAYIDEIKKCQHIFYTGRAKGHIETTCIKCGISSNTYHLIKMPEQLKKQLEQIIITLFFHGEMCDQKYKSVTGEFSSLNAAKEAWRILSEEGKTNLAPEEAVEKMLKIRDSRMRRY